MTCAPAEDLWQQALQVVVVVVPIVVRPSLPLDDVLSEGVSA